MNHDLPLPDKLPEDFRPTPDDGLTEREAARRAEDGQSNRVKDDPGKTVWQILAENLFNLFNLLNFALAACLILVGSYRNMLFLGVVLSNTLIGTVQELRAKHAIRRLKLLNAPVAHVLREGRERAVKPDELVAGDLVVVRGGDQIVADAVVRKGAGAANESLLTGESDAVLKGEGDWLLSGSYVSEGRFVCQLVHVGENSYAARLTRSAKAIKRPKSTLMTDLNKLLRLVSLVLLPLGLLLFCKQFFLSRIPLQSAVPSTVAAMLGMIPEGLILLTSVAMAVGVVRLSRRNTLVQELYGIETLARTDVLCLDKTGTITKGEMQVEALFPRDADEQAMKDALARFLSAFDGQSATLDALRRFVAPARDVSCAVLHFSSQRKKSAASFPDGTTLVLGAPGFVLGNAMPPDLEKQAETLSAKGMRVMALCRCDGTIAEGDTPPVTSILGLVTLSDTLRDNAAQTLRYFDAQGVTVKVISGDDPRTVSAVAGRVGLTGWDRWVDASALQTDEALCAAAEAYTVFGRVTPPQKKRLVEALKQAGHSVAMTGDGVNDIPALKAADCSIAMAGGSDAAKHAAQLTVLDADFAHLPQVVGEGRRVINNITRAASLFLVKTLYSFGLSVLLLLIPAAYPFQPIQLTLISTLTIGIPSFFLALEPNCERIRGDFLQNVLLRAVPGAAAVTVCAAIAMTLELFGYNVTMCSTLATLAAGIVGLMVLSTVCRPLTALRAAVLTAMSVGFTAAVIFLGRVFFLQQLTPHAWLTLAALTVIALLIMFLVTRLMRPRARGVAPGPHLRA